MLVIVTMGAQILPIRPICRVIIVISILMVNGEKVLV